MYSLSVPVPGRVARLVPDLFPYLAPFDRVHGRHTLVYGRFGDTDPDHLHGQLWRAPAGRPTFEARVTDVRFLEGPPRGAAPVVCLAVDSPGLLDLHRTLANDLGAIEGIKGDDYVPHVTLARGGSVADAHTVANQPLDSIEWTISQLDIYDSPFCETTTSISLSA